MATTNTEMTAVTKKNQNSSIRLIMLQSLDHCIRANPVNYFITVPVNALPLLLEKLYGFDEKSQVSPDEIECATCTPYVQFTLMHCSFFSDRHFESPYLCYVGFELCTV
jgi:hypothetical protein